MYAETLRQLSSQLYQNSDLTERVIRTRKFIDKNFDKPIPLSTIASAVYCSRFHLNREFKRHYGVTPLQYIKEKRIERAKQLLCGHSSVTTACYSVGYESLSTFSAMFKQCTGLSPGDFKKSKNE
jgi:AraC-like DNA-binding protein